MIYLRVDDFPNTKGEPQHTLAAFRDFDRVIRTYMPDGGYLLGVIPKRCSMDDLVYLRNETNCRIGMHGITHDEKMLDLHKNEFEPYLTRSTVRQRLTETREILEGAVGRPVSVYMPPRNQIDLRTIEELPKAGFWSYTTGPETPEQFRTGHSKAAYIDSQPPHHYGRTDEMFMRQSYRALNERSQQGLHSFLTLHWTWETNIGLDHLHRFLEQIRIHLKSWND